MFVTTVVVVEIFTTDGINFSARSAKEAGTGLELTFKEKLNDITIVNNIIYLSGQIGTLNNGKLVEGGIKEETRQTMMNIKSILEKNGSSLEKIFKCTCMLADIKDWPEMSEEYRKFFNNDLPSRSAFAGSGLALNARVEIECWAIK